MPEIVTVLEQNPLLERALFPGVDVRLLMSRNNPRPTPEEAKLLTRWHEASHAVVATVLRHASCSVVSLSDPMKPGAQTPIDRTVDAASWMLAADLVDLAGLYGEFVAIEDVHGCRLAYQHIKNAFFDLETARKRIALSRDGEAEWAAARGALTLKIVRYFQPAIRAVAAKLGEVKTLSGEDVANHVRTNPPRGPAEPAIREILKPWVGVRISAASHSGGPESPT